MSKTRVLFGLAMAVALPISIQAVSASAAEVTPPPAPAVPQVMPLDATFPLLIDAGSAKAYSDSQGRTWRADDGFIGGNVVDRGAVEIDGTSDDRIYQTERWGFSGYAAKVPNGKYTVRLHFAETFHDAAAIRLFSVKVEDRAIADLDVFAEAGGKNKALVKTLDEVVVADGEMNIDFTGAGALVNGIEVAQFAPAAPPVITLSGGSIRENAAPGEAVATVSAKGATTDVFRYALSNDAGGRFVIDAQSGAISVAQGAALDFETASAHEIEASATDAKGTVTKQRFTIQVLDVNEVSQGLKLTQLLAENAPAGTQVGVVAPIDPSITNAVFSLKDNAGGRFVIDPSSGTIRVAAGATLDVEKTPRHSLIAVAKCASGAVIEQALEVALADVNEPPSVLFMSAQSVANAAPAGTIVGVASTVDPDANEKFTYSLVDDAQGRFVINATTGAVSVAANAKLDSQAAPTHRIIIKATDSAAHSVTNGFTVSVGATGTQAAAQPQPTLIEAGSTAGHVDAEGRKWTPDTGFIGGDIVDRGAIEIAGTTNDRIYQTERYGLTGYALTVTPGLYTVKLHFAETFATAAGARVFSADVEGQKLTDIDIFAAVGAKTALVKSLSNVVVTDGKLDISFTNKTGGTMINAIEVEPVLNCQAMAQ